jgi:hypothetical protein
MNKTTFNSFAQGNKFKSQNENNEAYAEYNNQIVIQWFSPKNNLFITLRKKKMKIL